MLLENENVKYRIILEKCKDYYILSTAQRRENEIF
jgi:hypothetical protein